MCLALRLVAVFTALCLVASSSLSAMPLVWCFGKDGHRAVETMLHHHGIQATDAFADDGSPTETHADPCSDWQLVNTAGAPHAKNLHAEPKALTPLLAYPPLKLVVGASFPPNGRRHVASLRPRPGAQLSVLRSVVLLI
jgi:hypothetical protein